MINKQLLFKILEIQSHSRQCGDMQNYLFDYVLSKGYEIELDNMDNLYITKGTADTYPCIVAHMDTVHNITKGGIEVAHSISNPDVVFGINPDTHRLTGIGGDDKCGIYAALHCLEILPECKVAFFVDEEIGCVGSSQANIDFFNNCRFVIQADRRGNNDFVYDICGPLSSEAFIEDVRPILKKFGYKMVKGMMTDVESLRDQDVGVSVANMSAGYYLPHTDSEYISLNDLENVCNMMLEMCETMEKVYPFHFVRSWKTAQHHTQTYDHKAYDAWWQKFDKHGNLTGVPEEAEEEEPEQTLLLGYKEMIDQQLDQAETYDEYITLLEKKNQAVIDEIENGGDYQVHVNGRKRNIADMTDAEWEDFENEHEQYDGPPNHHMTKERYF